MSEFSSDSYVLATGVAALMGADVTRQHLFARRYDYEVSVNQLLREWNSFVSEGDPKVPDRMFVDDMGRRWEWCGGESGTWAWRMTGTSPVTADAEEADR